MRPVTIVLTLCLAATTSLADDDTEQQQVIVVNAAVDLNSSGPVARLRRVLDSRQLLVELDDELEATLDGRSSLITDLDAMREAYGRSELDAALAIIDANEQRVLAEPIARDPTPLLAELGQWRGLIAAASDQPAEAVRWFRAAFRFNPAWVMDERLASPRVRSLVKRAKREVAETGMLRVRVDHEDAQVSIDGGEPRPARERRDLATGWHLVIVTARGRKPHAELVDISDRGTTRLEARLDDESKLDRAARLVDATTAAPAGKPRLKTAGKLAKLTGVPRLLVIEGGSADRLTLRLYDVAANKVSQPVELEAGAPSAAIARQITAALEPENLVDAPSAQPRAKRWYSRWYVWAAAGAVAAAGAGAYVYSSREPEMLRGL